MEPQKPNLHQDFTLRGESFKDGMLLLMEYLIDLDWKCGNKFSARSDVLTKTIERHYEEFKDKLKNEKVSSFEVINSHFNNLIQSYTSILSNDTTLKHPLESLRYAECCRVWKKGREHFDTQILVDNSNDRNLESLKIVLSETPYTDSDILQPEYTVPTTWSKSLPQWQQDFITKNQKELSKKSIPSSFRGVAGLANLSHHKCKVNDVPALSYFRHATQLPIDLLGQKGTEDEQFRLTCLNIASQIRLSLDEKLKYSADSSEKEKEKKEKQEELVILSQSIVSPGVIANVKARFISTASDNDTKIYELKEQAIQLFQHALANPEAKIDDDEIKRIFFLEEKNEKDLFYNDFLKKWRLNVPHNTHQDKPVKLTLVSTNHPLNVLRHFEAYQPQVKNNEKNTAFLLGAVARYLGPLKRANEEVLTKEATGSNKAGWNGERPSKILECLARPDLGLYLNELINELNFCENTKKLSLDRTESIIKRVKALLGEDIRPFLDKNTLKLMHALYALLSIPNGQGVLENDEMHKPQLRSMAEIMIVNCLNGAAWIACKSGKDRTGGASIAADAAEIYYQQYKKFPNYQDDLYHREAYLSIIYKLYKSGHHQELASENAPGAKGLVKAKYFLPTDLKLDPKNTQLETQLARLNKPKAVKNSPSKLLNYEIFDKDFQDIKNKVINFALGKIPTLIDWKRNRENYFINGESVETLQNNKEFENENDVSEFIDNHLLKPIKSNELKEYYKALLLYSFHHGGFLHTFAKVSQELINKCYALDEAIIEQPTTKINFSWSEKYKGIQIEEINTYEEKKFYGEPNSSSAMPSDKKELFCQINSCIVLNLSRGKSSGHKLNVTIENLSIDCLDEKLKPLFFKKTTLIEAFVRYFHSVLMAIKRYFDELFKLSPVLNEEWLMKFKGNFFSESTPATMKEGANKPEGSLQTQISDEAPGRPAPRC